MFGLFGDPLNTQFEDVESARYLEAKNVEPVPEAPERLEVMSWNIKFGGGRIKFFFDCGGSRVHMNRDEVAEHLSGLVTKVEQVNPDVLFLQEIDVDSKRAAYVDQVQWLLDNSPLNYAVYASQWKADYVPKKWLGSVDSGIAILSRWPLSDATRHALPLIDAQDPVTRYFYLKRAILEARLELPTDEQLTVVNTHLTAFAQDDTKNQQARLFKDHLDGLRARDKDFIAAGDLNTVPPGSQRRKDFADVKACPEDILKASDYSDEVGLLDGYYEDFEAAIPLSEYRSNNEPYFSYTGDEDGFWNRKLDYIFSSRQLKDGLVHQDRERGGMKTMPLSDHAPVTAFYPLEH